MLPILFGILTSLCFAVASLLAQRGYHIGPAPWGAWITIAANAAFLLAGHLLIEGDTRCSSPTILSLSPSAYLSPESPGC